jgi:hypothetical protein
VKAGGRAKKTSVALLAASMVLAACGGGAKPDPSSSRTTGSSPTTTATAPTTSASPTATADPNIPAAARAHTPAGAAAFVKYFHDQLNVAWRQPKSGLLAPLSLPDCKTCAALETTAVDMVTKQQHMLGDAVRIDSVDPGNAEPNGDQTMVITGAQLGTSIVDTTGRKVRDIPANKIRSLATARWTSSGWRVGEIKALA